MKRICIICNKDTKGIGCYSFTYIDETIFLCGHHAQELMKLIHKLKEKVIQLD